MVEPHWQPVTDYLAELVERVGGSPVTFTVHEPDPTQATIYDAATGVVLVTGTRVTLGAWLGGGMWATAAAGVRLCGSIVTIRDEEAPT